MIARALIADPSVPVAGTLRKYLEAEGFEVRVVQFLDEAVEKVRGGEADLVFAAVSASFDGETLCRKVKQLQPECPVVLVFSPEEEDAGAHTERAGADACLVGPLKRPAVGSCAKSMVRIRALEERLRTASSGGDEFEFLKKLLPMEVKRSRRYRYPVSFLIVALDAFSERTAQLPPAQRTAALAEALGVVTTCIRDIDLAVPFKDERFLVFLPHTSREGALIVAGRLRDRLRALQGLPGCTASVGVAAHEPGGARAQVSFGTLMKDATEALARAQSAGGNAVEASAKKPRDRISLG